MKKFKVHWMYQGITGAETGTTPVKANTYQEAEEKFYAEHQPNRAPGEQIGYTVESIE